MPLVLGASVGFHVALAAVLAALPVVGRGLGLPEDLIVAVDFLEVAAAPIPEPELVPEPEVLPPEPEPVPVAVRPRERIVPETPEPEPVRPEPEPEPAPVAAVLPPSVDDVFGAPPPPMGSLTAPGGDFAVPEGAPGGVPGGRAGGVAGGRVGAGAVATASAGPSGPDPAERRRARDAYKRMLERFLREHMTYPRAAARERIEGRVELALRIGSDGSLLGVRLASSSGCDLLDREAMSTARDAGPMPVPPELCALRPSDELRVGMVYRLR